MGQSVYILDWTAWSPGISAVDEWAQWAAGERSLEKTAVSPPIGHVEPMFKRRFSQLTRMTLHVGHRILAAHPGIKTAFASVYGEINQQYKITTALLEAGEVSPANFSLSVFNTPVGALSIVEKNSAGYVTCFPGPDCFRQGMLETATAVLSGADSLRLFICADELLPESYWPLVECVPVPHALALLVSASAGTGSGAIQVPLDSLRPSAPVSAGGVPYPLEFLRDVLLAGARRV